MPALARPRARIWLGGVLLISALYLGLYLTRGWYPHDEGANGQTAERVLQGEVPHLDFDEPYTGLLTYVHALAFELGGFRLPVLRIPLYLATLLWLAAFFRIGIRFVSAASAAALTVLALAWSVPNYPASMPSWYNLFCATFGVLALLKWDETGARRWLFLAGLAGGVSFLIKFSGLFYAAGALLFLLYATRERRAGPEGEGSEAPRPRRAAAALISTGLLVFVAALWRAISPYYWPRTVLHFVLPGALLAGALVAREWVPAADSDLRRLRSLFGALLPYLAGIALPVAIFFGAFGIMGALSDLLHGVFVAPFRRLAFANMRPPPPLWILASIPLLLVLWPRVHSDPPRWRRVALGVALVLTVVLWLASVNRFAHRAIWESIRSLIPLTSGVAAAVIGFPQFAVSWTGRNRRGFVLLAAVTATASLIQFPYSSPIYFLYTAPLLLLTLVALIQGIGRTPRQLASIALAFYGVFALLLATPGAVVRLALQYEPEHATVPLELPRGGLHVLPGDAALYGAMIPELQLRAGAGAIWAGPDAPEIYFLGGFRNRTRSLFDFLAGEGTELLAMLDREGVRAIAVNWQPAFSPRLSPALTDVLRARFPEAVGMGHFELRWRR